MSLATAREEGAMNEEEEVMKDTVANIKMKQNTLQAQHENLLENFTNLEIEQHIIQGEHETLTNTVANLEVKHIALQAEHDIAKETIVTIGMRQDIIEREHEAMKRTVADMQKTQNEIDERLGVINERLEDNSHPLSQSSEEISDEIGGLEMCVDDGTNHCYLIKDTLWYSWVHQSRSSNPSDLFNNFKYSDYAPEDFHYQMYEHGTCSTHTISDLDETFLDKFNTMFCKDIERQPWLLTNLHEDCVDDRNFYNFCRMLQTWCFGNKYSFLITDYDCQKHLERFSFNMEKLNADLQIRGRDDPKNRVLIYQAERKMIFNIRFLDASNIDSNSDSNRETKKKMIMDAMRKSQNDFKFFSTLYMETIRNSGICFATLTAIKGLSSEELHGFDLCTYCEKHLFITEDDLEDNHMLERKLERINHIREQRSAPREHQVPVGSFKDNFVNLASKIWGYMSLKDVHLPNISMHAFESLVRVYLNNDQRRILYSRDRHVILRGGYGSGKSILAQMKFKELIHNGGVDDYFYLICFANETLYTDTIRSRMRDLRHNLREEQVSILNVDEYARKFGLQTPITVSDVLVDLNDRHGSDMGTPHLIADELDGARLTTEEGMRINDSLREDSYVLIVTQSIQVVRKRVEKGILEKTVCEQDGYRFENTGMRVKTLDLIMRNCTRINALSRVVVKMFAKHKSTFTERLDICGNNTSVDTVTASTSEDVELDTFEHVDEDEDLFGTSEEVHNEEQAQSTTENEDEVVVENLDHMFKMISTNIQQCTDHIVQNTFEFPGEWEHGHSVKGPIPKIIFPFSQKRGINYDEVNSPENKARMLYTLRHIIDIGIFNSSKFAVICFDKIEAQIMFEIMKVMGIEVVIHAPTLFPAKKTFNNILNVAKTHVLLTDHIGVRGLEFQRVVVTLDPNEPYLQHYLAEALSRCIEELYIVVINKSGKQKEEKGIIQEIINKWKKKELVEQHVVKICKKHLEEHYTHGISCDQGQGEGIHYIHPWNDRFDKIKKCGEIKYDDSDVAAMQNRMITNAKAICNRNKEEKKRSHVSTSSERN